MGKLKFNAYASGAKTTWTMVSWTDNTVDALINNAPNTDSISFRYYEGPLDAESDVTLRGNHPNSSAVTQVSDSDVFQDDDFYIIFDPNDTSKPGSMLQVTGFSNSGGGEAVIHAAVKVPITPPTLRNYFLKRLNFYRGLPCRQHCSNLGSNNFAWCRYYVDANRNLIVQRRSAPSSALVSRIVAAGIEDLQLKYQFKDGTWRDAPIDGNANYDIENIRAVRVSLIARTEKPDTKFISSTSFQMTGDNGNGVAHRGGVIEGWF